MMKFSSFTLFLSCLCTLLVLLNTSTATIVSTTAESPSVADFLGTNTNLTTFTQFLRSNEVFDSLNSTTSYTVFAFTDNAYDNLSLAEKTAFNAAGNSSILYHIVLGSFTLSSFTNNQLVTSLVETNGRNTFIFNNDANTFTVNGLVISSNITCSNGVVHILDSRPLLLPTTFITEAVESGSVLASDVQFLGAALKLVPDVETKYDSLGTFTMFLPTDAALAQLNSYYREFLLSNPSSLLDDLFLFHGSDGALFSQGLKALIPLGGSLTVKSLNVQQFPLVIKRTEESRFFINDIVEITAFDAVQFNGVVHIVDAIVQFKPSQVLSALTGFTNFTNYLTTNNLLSAFDEAANSTILAPNDSAFSALTAAQLAYLQKPGNLGAVLALHMLDKNLYSDSFTTDEQLQPTRNLGASYPSYQLRINFYPASTPKNVTIEGSAIIPSLRDIAATNGNVIHCLEAPLVQIPNLSLNATIANPPGSLPIPSLTFSSFLAALAFDSAASQTLALGDRVTAFVPTDAAFTALPDNVELYLHDNDDLLQTVVDYHIAQGKTTFSAAVGPTAGSSISVTTLDGNSHTLSRDSNGALLLDGDSSLLSVIDFPAANGVLYAINAVLLPESTLYYQLPFSGFTKFATLLANSALASLLKSKSSIYTVLAPTDDAFLANPTLYARLQSDDVYRNNYLKFTILAGTFNLTSVTSTAFPVNLLSTKIRFDLYNGTVYVLGSRLSGDTFEALNGNIIALDTVVVPPTDTITTLSSVDDLSIFTKALNQTSLPASLIDSSSNLTIFAPNNQAMTDLNKSNPSVTTTYVATLFAHIANHHVLTDTFYSDGLVLQNGKQLDTAAGDKIGVTVTTSNNQVVITLTPDLAVIVGDSYLTSNGVVHVITKVLLPNFNALETLQFLGHTQFVSLVAYAGLSDELSAYTSYTVFSVNDVAFNASARNPLLLPQAAAAALVHYHIIPYAVPFDSFADQTSYNTVASLFVRVNTKSPTVYINGVPIVSTLTTSTGSVIYTLDTLLYTPTSSLLESLSALPAASTFVKVVNASTTLKQTLTQSTTPITVFVPNDDALNQISAAVFTNYPEIVEKILSFHIVTNKVLLFSLLGNYLNTPFTSALDGQNVSLSLYDSLYALEPGNLKLSALNDSLSNNGAMIGANYFHLPVFNGFEQVKYLVDTHFVSMLQSVGLDTVAASTSDITIFSFDDNAYNALTDAQKTSLNDNAFLQNILKYHMVSKISTHDIVDSGIIKTMYSGANIRTNIYRGDFYLNGYPLLNANQVVSNGFVSSVSAVLFPPTTNVYQYISSQPNLSTLKALIDSAGLAVVLSDVSSVFTFFAPTNAAFVKLGTDTRLQDKDFAKNLLLGHALGRTLFLVGFDANSPVLTLSGRSVNTNVNAQTGTYTFDVAKINTTVSDVLCFNGVVQVIDTVIISAKPPSDSGSSSGGAIAAGVIVPLVVIGAGVGYWYWRRRKSRYQYTPLI